MVDLYSCPPPKVVGPHVKKNKAATALTLLADAVRDSWASPPALPTFEALDLETQLCAWWRGTPRRTSSTTAACRAAWFSDLPAIGVAKREEGDSADKIPA